MKKTPVIITVIVIAFLGLGFLLYKISPKTQSALDLKSYDLSQATKLDAPSAVTEADHVLGNAQAKNILVAYEDVQCPACRAFNPVLDQLPTALTDTKLVFRHYPLYPRPHPNSLAAAYATEAAGAQGKFWEFTNLMYERQPDWADLANPLDVFAQIAKDAGVPNTEQFKQNILDSKYAEKIQKDAFEAVGVGSTGTPTLFFNGHKIEFRLGTVDEIKQLVAPYYIK